MGDNISLFYSLLTYFTILFSIWGAKLQKKLQKHTDQYLNIQKLALFPLYLKGIGLKWGVFTLEITDLHFQAFDFFRLIIFVRRRKHGNLMTILVFLFLFGCLWPFLLRGKFHLNLAVKGGEFVL